MSFYESTYLLLAIVILSFTLTPFLRKKILHEFTDEEFYIYSNIFIISLILIYSFYLLISNKCSLDMVWNKMTTRNAVICLVSSITAIIGSIVLLVLLKRNDASFVIPQIQPIVIVLTMLIGYFLAGEDVNKYKAMGTIFIVGGLILFNFGKNKN